MSLEDPAPDEVLALRFDEKAVAEEIAAWCGGKVERTPVHDGPPTTCIWVPTSKGPRAALLGDWVVRHAEDEHVVMDSAAFAALHSPA
jgi:hypothetical protein